MPTFTTQSSPRPRFSIVVGTYNQEGTLPMLVEALNNQTFKDFEVLFCDDGSTDGTQEYLSDVYTEFMYRYYRQKNKGMRLAKNLNQGISQAEGEYCVFIMGDSFPDPHYLEVLNQFVDPDRVLCGVRYEVHDGKGVDVDWRLKKAIIPPENSILVANPWEYTTGNGLCVPTRAFRLYGGWDESIEGYGGDDNEIVARLYFKGYVVWSIVDAKLYHHWHKASPSKNTNHVINKVRAYAS